MNRTSVIVCLCVVLLALSPMAAAAQPHHTETYIPIVLAPTATVTGTITGRPEEWPPHAVTVVWLAQYVASPVDANAGIWVLDPATAPQARVDAHGRFTIRDVPGGMYCVLIGWDPMGGLWTITNDDGRARVYDMREGGAVDLGEIIMG